MEDIKKAIAVLKYHQEWRKGAEIPQTDVKKLTNALDTAIEILSKWEDSERWKKVEEELPEVRQSETYRILVADADFVNMNVFHVSTQQGIEYVKMTYKFWKPIH